MNKSELIQYINNSDKLNDESLIRLQNLIETYPYFQTAHLLLAKNRHTANRHEFEKHLPKTAALCADRQRLFYLINNEKYAPFFPKVKSSANSDRTQVLLDSYLETFSEEYENHSTIEKNMVSTDYLAYLQKLDESAENETADTTQNQFRHQDIIDRFLEKAAADEITIAPLEQQPPNFREVNACPEPQNGGFLTETLAKIYIKQKKYEQALAIIRQLSLNFPKKSIYFADQIRFLELLILNEKNKKQ